MPLPLSPDILTFFRILSFAHGELLILEVFYSLTLARLLSPSNTPSFAPNFYSLGYESSSLFQSSSAGIFFSLISLLLIMVGVFSLLTKILSSSPSSLLYRCSRCFIWCPFIRLTMESFLELTLCSSLALYSVSPSLIIQFVNPSVSSKDSWVFLALASLTLAAMLLLVVKL